MKFNVKQSAELMGNFLGYHKIAENTLAESLTVEIYLVKYERHPLRFIFEYYRPKEDWIFFNFSYDEDIDDDMQEMMKYDYLRR